MKLHSTIVVPNGYNSDYECDICLEKIEGFLYNTIIGQEIKMVHEGKGITTKVIGVSDNVYGGAIYRRIEVVVINTSIK